MITDYFNKNNDITLSNNKNNIENKEKNNDIDAILEQLSSWKKPLEEYISTDHFKKMMISLPKLYENKKIYPPINLIFNAFRLTNFDNLKVVIIGQDPYHGKGQAEGLSFSVPKGIKKPPSLKNIYKCLKKDYQNFVEPDNPSLEGWAKQGVLLLNDILTVEEGKPGSHKTLGWRGFTDYVIKIINNTKENIVFMLWGSFAIEKAKTVNKDKHLILTSVHPSPLSASKGFFDCKHFLKTNQYLKEKNIAEINWLKTN